MTHEQALYILGMASQWLDTLEEALNGEADFFPSYRIADKDRRHIFLLGQMEGISLMLSGTDKFEESEIVYKRLNDLRAKFDRNGIIFGDSVIV